MMVGRKLLALVAALGLATAAAAQDPENVLVIDVDGATKGTVEIELLPEVAPQHVARIKELARAGAYDGVVFHRVIDGFMAQTGDVEFGKREALAEGRAGTGGSDLPDLPAEFSDALVREGHRRHGAGDGSRTRPTASSSSCSRPPRTSTASTRSSGG